MWRTLKFIFGALLALYVNRLPVVSSDPSEENDRPVLPEGLSLPSQSISPWEPAFVDRDELETILGGPLRKRKFVTLERVGNTHKMVEQPYVFKPAPIREKREKAKHQIDKETAAALNRIPGGYNSTTVYIRYTHQLSMLERIQDTPALLDDPCRPTTILETDYCERAAFPNKGKMVCNGVTDPRMNLKKNTCICKFYRLHDTETRWRRMTRHKLSFNGDVLDSCMVPRNGECNHRVNTGLKDINGRFIFEVDVCQGHYECDNTPFLPEGVVLNVTRHCTADEFLSNFEEQFREDVLLCAKPHPRRFRDYDEYKYYCLPAINRDPNQRGFIPPPDDDDDMDEDEDVVQNPLI